MSRPLSIMLAAFALSLLALPAWAGPKIVFDRTEIVFSKVREGDILKADFYFRNKGDQNLIIDKVSPSCGCTVASFSKVVKPGQRGVVRLRLDTFEITGIFRKTAVVASNDIGRPFVTLVMIGETSGLLKVDKGRRIELSGCLGETIATTVRLSHPEGKKLRIRGFENPMKHYLSARLRRAKGGKDYLLYLRATALRPVDFAGPIFVHLPRGKRVSLYVVVRVKGAVKMQPRQVFFGTVIPGLKKGASRSVLLQRQCVSSMKVQALAYDQKAFKITQIWERLNDRLLLVITPRPYYLGSGSFSRQLVIRLAGRRPLVVTLKGRVPVLTTPPPAKEVQPPAAGPGPGRAVSPSPPAAGGKAKTLPPPPPAKVKAKPRRIPPVRKVKRPPPPPPAPKARAKPLPPAPTKAKRPAKPAKAPKAKLEPLPPPPPPQALTKPLPPPPALRRKTPARPKVKKAAPAKPKLAVPPRGEPKKPAAAKKPAPRAVSKPKPKKVPTTARPKVKKAAPTKPKLAAPPRARPKKPAAAKKPAPQAEAAASGPPAGQAEAAQGSKPAQASPPPRPRRGWGRFLPGQAE